MSDAKALTYLALWTLLLCCPCLSPLRCSTAQARSRGPGLRVLYLRANRHFKRKNYVKARALFLRVLPKLIGQQRRLKPKTRRWYMLSLGRCDVLFHLAYIRLQKNQRRQACLHYSRLVELLTPIPPIWKKRWNVHPDLPGRLEEGEQQYTTICPAIPALLTISSTPKNATLSQKQLDGRWKIFKERQLEVLTTATQIRLSAPGYLTLVREISVPRWTHLRLSLSLKLKPKPRPRVIARVLPRRAPRPAPPPRRATPFYQQWWFWTGVGVVAVGGTVTAIALTATAKQEYVVHGSLFKP